MGYVQCWVNGPQWLLFYTHGPCDMVWRDERIIGLCTYGGKPTIYGMGPPGVDSNNSVDECDIDETGCDRSMYTGTLYVVNEEPA